jgi:hypothetical protein
VTQVEFLIQEDCKDMRVFVKEKREREREKFIDNQS